MIKKFALGIALMAISVASISAANIAGKQDSKTRSENIKGNNKRGDVKKGENRDPRNIEDSKEFKGIKLTDAQKNKLQELQKSARAQANEKKESMKNLSKEDREKMKEKMKNLSQEERQKMNEERMAKRLESKKKYLAGVKSILTPEQYTIFLENTYVYGNNPGKGKSMHKHDGKGNRMKGHSAKAGMKQKGQKKSQNSYRKNASPSSEKTSMPV